MELHPLSALWPWPAKGTSGYASSTHVLHIYDRSRAARRRSNQPIPLPRASFPEVCRHGTGAAGSLAAGFTYLRGASRYHRERAATSSVAVRPSVCTQPRRRASVQLRWFASIYASSSEASACGGCAAVCCGHWRGGASGGDSKRPMLRLALALVPSYPLAREHAVASLASNNCWRVFRSLPHHVIQC